jgi:hypothetical protein
LPAELADQEAFRRHHQELPERTGRGGDAHGPGTPLGRHIAPDHPVDDRIGGAGLGDADQHARAQRKRQRGGRMGHAEQARGIEQGAGDDHAKGPETVRHHAREDAGRAPGDVLDRDGKGKGLTRPSLGLRDGLQPEPETVADAHGQGDDGRTAGQYLRDGEGFRGRMHSVTLLNPKYLRRATGTG